METKILMNKYRTLATIVKKHMPYHDPCNTIVECWHQYSEKGRCRPVLIPTNDFIPVIDGLLKRIEELERGPVGVSSRVVILMCSKCRSRNKRHEYNPPIPDSEPPTCYQCGEPLDPKKDRVTPVKDPNV